MREKMTGRALAILLLGICLVAPASAQTVAPPAARPLPAPLAVPANFQRAIARGTRTSAGAPGTRYWMNTASYRITARILADTKRLEGAVDMVYRNNSPDTLTNLHIDVTQNFHRADAVRAESAEITNGMELRRVTVAGQNLKEGGENGARYQVFGTRLIILPPRPVLPGTSVPISIDYAFTIPQKGIGERVGWSRADLFFIGYWYPQMAVYDDMIGWHPDPFTGTAEFYADFGSYDYTIDMPAGWLLLGTGNLINAQQVLAPEVYQRLQRAETSDQVVNIVTTENLGAVTAAGTSGRLLWHFVADNVRDVAFVASRKSFWDAMRTPVGDRNGDGKPDYSRVDAIWRASAPLWKNSARHSAHAIAFFSRYTGLPYPYPHMTAVEGEDIMDGGMEFPMMTLIGPYTGSGDAALYATTAHEESHMWFPMIVSSDERRYSWMDEGTTQFNENQAEKDYFHESGARFDIEDQEGYLTIARAGEEGEILRRSAYHYTPWAYGVATYDKPASLLAVLRGVLGDSVFLKAYREYTQRWKYKHPYPADMWNTFENVSGKDLDWFWQQWYNTTWALDQSVAGVTNTAGGALIRIDDRGFIAMPVTLTITRANGETLTRVIAVDTWLTGATSTTLTVPGSTKVVKVEIDAARAFPDVNRANNVWPR